MRLTLTNRARTAATLHVCPTLWFRNTWSWNRPGEDSPAKPALRAAGSVRVRAEHETLGPYVWTVAPGSDGAVPRLLFTENETNVESVFGAPNRSPYVKDAFHERIVSGKPGPVDAALSGTKCAAVYRVVLAPGASEVLRLRLCSEALEREVPPASPAFDETFARRRKEADEFYDARTPATASPEERQVMRQARAGLLWSKQFMRRRRNGRGDPASSAAQGAGGSELSSGVTSIAATCSMPDKWSTVAAWDLAFHAVALADSDLTFAKEQNVPLLRGYMHPNGQIPRTVGFSTSNPPSTRGRALPTR